MQIILISHFDLAQGLKKSLCYFTSEAENIIAINAYSDIDNPEEELRKVISKIDTDERVLIFSDILGGSVNQYTLPYLSNENFFIFTGMNLPMVLQSLFLNEDATPEEIYALEKVGKEAVVSMNTYTVSQMGDEDE